MYQELARKPMGLIRSWVNMLNLARDDKPMFHLIHIMTIRLNISGNFSPNTPNSEPRL